MSKEKKIKFPTKFVKKKFVRNRIQEDVTSPDFKPCWSAKYKSDDSSMVIQLGTLRGVEELPKEIIIEMRRLK
jgi:hypothetical protein